MPSGSSGGSDFSITLNVTLPNMPVPNHNFQITLTPSGVIDSRYPGGVVPPVPPTLTWISIPGVPNGVAGTSQIITLAAYLTAVGGTPVYAVATGFALPAGWSLNSTTGVLTNPSGLVGSASVKITAAIGAVAATSPAFPLQITSQLTADVLAPTIPTGLTVAAGATNVLTWDAASDPVYPGQISSGMASYSVKRDATAGFATVTSPAVGLASQYVYTDVGAVGLTGSATQNVDGTDWSISSAGTDIFNSPDAFGYLAVQVNGAADGVATLIEKQTGFTGTNANAKSGLMFRQSLATNSPFALLTFQAGGGADGLALIARATAGAVPSTTGIPAPAFPFFTKLTWTLATSTFAAFYSTNGLAWVLIGSAIVPTPNVIYAGHAVCSLSSGARATASIAQLNLQNLPSPTYTDPAGGAHTYSVESNDVAGNASALSPQVQTGTGVAYLKAAGPSTYVLSGATLNLFTTSTPLDALNGTFPNGSSATFPTVTVGAPGPATGKCPAIINVFTVAGNQVDAGGRGFYITMAPSCPAFTANSAPNGWLSLAVGAKNAGAIPLVTQLDANPAGSGNNPWTFGGGVLTPGSATNLAWLAGLDALVPGFKALAALGFWLYAPTGENNLTNANWAINGNNWTGISSGATSAQVAQLQQMRAQHMKAAGVTNFGYVFQTNLGVGNTLYSYAPGIYDFCFCDSVPIQNDPTAYAAMQSTGLPMGYGSAILNDPNASTRNGFNTYTGLNTIHGMGAQQIVTTYNFGLVVWWPQQVALNLQLGALQAMTTFPYIDASQVPALTIGGGRYG